MSTSSLLGIERPNPGTTGHNSERLGPSDSSDSGSDMTGLDTPDVLDPQLPVDRALADDLARPLGPTDAHGSDSDSAGTGERRSAAGDDGGREAGDIAVDRAFRPLGDDEAENEEDESADPVGDGYADAALAASLPPRPDRPNPEPDPPPDAPPVSPEGDLPPVDDGGPHLPGREPALRSRRF